MSRKQYVIKVERDTDLRNPRDDWEQMGTMVTWHRRYTLGGKEDQNNVDKVEDSRRWMFENIYLHQTNRLEEKFQGFGYFGYSEDLKYYLTDAEMREYVRLQDLAEVGELSAEFEERLEFLDTLYTSEEPTPEMVAEFEAAFDKWVEDNVCIKALFCYEHSGITLWTSPFSSGMDNSGIGFIYLTRQKCEEEQVDFDQADRILEGEVKTLDQYLTGDVWYFNSGSLKYYVETEVKPQYVDDNVEIYLFTGCEEVPDELEDFAYSEDDDSCGGFYGEDHMMEHVANEIIPYIVKQEDAKAKAIADKLHKTYWCM